MAGLLLQKCESTLLFRPELNALRLYHKKIKVDENGKIVDAKYKTFGCGSVIVSSSLATELVKGKSVDEALKIKNIDIAKELCLPSVKLHCSMLAEDAIKAALSDCRAKQLDRK